MNSDHAVTRLSDGQCPAVHHYYDVPVEEPGGGRIIYCDSKPTRFPAPRR